MAESVLAFVGGVLPLNPAKISGSATNRPNIIHDGAEARLTQSWLSGFGQHKAVMKASANPR